MCYLAARAKLLRRALPALYPSLQKSAGRDENRAKRAAGLRRGAALFRSPYRQAGHSVVFPDWLWWVDKVVVPGADVLQPQCNPGTAALSPGVGAASRSRLPPGRAQCRRFTVYQFNPAAGVGPPA